MADSSLLCFTTLPPLRTLIPSSRISSRWPSSSFPNFSLFREVSKRLICPCAKDSQRGDSPAEDSFGFYPWESSRYGRESRGFQWIPEDRITLFTSDGLIQIGGSLVPHRTQFLDRRQQGRSTTSPRLQRFQEKDYMDPDQSLCLGALFDIAATNGLDMGRKLCIFGFCRSIEMLNDVVEDTVIEHGGEVVAAEKASEEGLHEKLTMIVSVPLLWGIPPASETLHFAVKSGGGIVEKVYWRWDFL